MESQKFFNMYLLIIVSRICNSQERPDLKRSVAHLWSAQSRPGSILKTTKDHSVKVDLAIAWDTEEISFRTWQNHLIT